MEYCKLMFLLVWALLATLCLVSAQVPPRLSIPGAVPVPVARASGTRTRRPAATLRAQQTLLQPHIAPRIIEESKPVTETAEEDLNEAYLPHLREQALTSAQQQQFQQTVAAFLNGEVNGIPDTPITHLLDEDESFPPTTPAQYSTRFPERNVINSPPNPKPTFNDFGIGSNIIGNGQKYGGERAPPVQIPAASPITRERVSVIRSRPVAREPKPQYEAQTAQIVARPRVKHIQPRPLIEQNQLHDEREVYYNKRKRPVVAQTLRKWREEHEDGSITWGYENDDGSFKEELIGTDCVTKGTYGYVDPDGNKREYHYETGIKCDPNRRNAEPDILHNNGFVNYDENRAILPNGIEIDMSQLGKKKSRRPAVNYKN